MGVAMLPKVRIVLCLVLIALSGSITSASASSFTSTSTSASASVYTQAAADALAAYNLKEHYTKYEYKVPMRDGKTLFTAVYAPKDGSKTYPFLMVRTPYSVAPYGVDLCFRMCVAATCRKVNSST
jgi:predicted acyl esterase